jgi:rhodanese-related sulfurtransferase
VIFAMRLITRQQLKAELDAGQPIKLVMTAGPWQVRAKHIPGTLKLLTPKDALGALRPEDRIVVYTIDDRLQSSAAAWEALTAHGYRNVRRYAGGLNDWEAAGHMGTAPTAGSYREAVRIAIRAGPVPVGPHRYGFSRSPVARPGNSKCQVSPAKCDG